MDLEGYGKIKGQIFALDFPNKQGAIAVYSYLCFRGGSKKYCFPSQATIAKAIGVSKSTVNRNLKNLEAKGFIKKINKQKENNVYMSTFYILLELVESNKELKKIEKEIDNLVSSMTQGSVTSETGSVTHDTGVVSPVERGSVTHDTLTITNNNNNEQYIYEQEKNKTTEEELLAQLEALRNKGVKENG